MSDSLDNLTGKLREKQPDLNQPGVLTEQIMQRIAAEKIHARQQPLILRKHRFSDPMLWVRSSLTAAAALLLLVLITQNTLAESSLQQTVPVSITKDLLPPLPSAGRSAVDAYRSHLLEHATENRIFRQHLHPQNQKQ